jgi:excisionase family DNA binding protein
LTRHDAAFALSLSVRSIDYLIANKKLTFRRIGKKVLIPADEVRRFARGDHPDSIRP